MTVVIIVVVVLVKVTFCPACNVIKTWIFHTVEENVSWIHSIFNVDIPEYKWLFSLWTFKKMLLDFHSSNNSFESWLWHWLSWLRMFMVFFSWMPGQYHKLDYDHFLPDCF
jgi:hypothetical protein